MAEIEEKPERFKIPARVLRRIEYASGDTVYRKVDQEQLRCIVREVRIKGEFIMYLVGEPDGEFEYHGFEITPEPDQNILLNMQENDEPESL
jgi:hypothetical protein